jgi:hypothetical protein
LCLNLNNIYLTFSGKVRSWRNSTYKKQESIYRKNLIKNSVHEIAMEPNYVQAIRVFDESAEGEKSIDGACSDKHSNLQITIYKDDTLCYTSTKVEDLPYRWYPRSV